MAKLYFRYGTVGSAKTLNLLAVAHSYKQQGKDILLIKPALDTRFGLREISSRAGISKNADILVYDYTELLEFIETSNYFLGKDLRCILVDEAQFLSSKNIDDLKRITIKWSVPVICYGLRSDFKTELFEGSKRLFELADSIQEIKSTCYYCNRKSTMNLKHSDGFPVFEGPSVELGTEEKYYPVCSSCYYYYKKA